MASDRIATSLIAGLILLTASLSGLILAIHHQGFHALSLLLLVVTGLILFGLYRRLSSSHRDLARFLDAARSNDYSQSFSSQDRDTAADPLSQSLQSLSDQIREDRQQQQTQLRRLLSLTEQVPVPLLSVHADETIELHNHAARQALSARPIHRLDDLGEGNAEMIAALKEISPGERRLVTFRRDGMGRQMAIRASTLIIGTERERLISLQDIHSELEQVQLKAWQDLVRVLTHEIMNSLTPVVSLAHTANDLVQEAQRSEGRVADYASLDTAVTTMARRSEGLMTFVQQYRSLSALPTPQLNTIRLIDLLAHVSTLMRDQWIAEGVDLRFDVEPETLTVAADSNLLEQVLINLLGNAWQAIANQVTPKLSISARALASGAVMIDVEDNGPGIDADLAEDVFLPFFTTRSDGSGIGLALTRQIMTAHGGTVSLDRSELGGARLSLVFPG